MYDDILNSIIERISRVRGIDPATLNADTCLVEDLAASSVDLARLATFLEAEYDAYLPYVRVRKEKTIGDVARLLDESL